jgi:hypothetical protein
MTDVSLADQLKKICLMLYKFGLLGEFKLNYEAVGISNRSCVIPSRPCTSLAYLLSSNVAFTLVGIQNRWGSFVAFYVIKSFN